VDEVVAAMGLRKCEATLIGSTQQRGVSGGERKRTSIAQELLTDPKVLLLDEPTSGIDSFTSLQIVHALRVLASRDRVVIASIHQPGSALFALFDRVILLADGHVA